MSQELPAQQGFENINRYEKEIERIQRTLERFLDKEGARKATEKIYDLALDIDENIRLLLDDPRVLEKYDYDGEFFKSKEGHSFYKAYNGPVFLKDAVSDRNIESFLSSYAINGRILRAVEYMLDSLWGNYVRLVQVLLENLKNRGDIRLIPKELLEEVIADARLREAARKSEEVQPLSPEERDFFQLYEEEMGLPDGELERWLREKIGEDNQSS